MTHSHQMTIEPPLGSGEGAREIEIELDYTYRGGSAPIVGGPPEACDPGEAAEIEIEGVWVSSDDRVIGPGWESWHGGLCLLPEEEARAIDEIEQNPPDDDYFDEDWDR